MEHLDLARAVTSALREVVDAASAELARRCERDGRISTGAMDEHQTAIYDLASVASALAAAEHLVVWGEKGDLEAKLALLLAADVAADLRGRIAGREAAWGVGADVLAPQAEAIAAGRSLELASEVSDAVLATGEAGKRHLPEDLEMVRQTFRRFADEQVKPVAEEVHRQDLDLPEEVIRGSRNSAVSRCRSPPNTAACPKVATTSSSTWSWSPRNCPGAPSASLAR
jgi:(2S)-methylsuccinyl-CoA dehydrogenase